MEHAGEFESEHGPASRRVLAGVLLLLAVGFGLDLLFDAPSNWRSAHVIFEVTLVVVSLAYALYLWRGWRVAERSLAAAQRSLDAHRAESAAWQRSARAALDGLGRAIDSQFTAWHLTPAERAVALLLLKGHGHKQIAAMANRSERTVRQHAVSIYNKSGLGGRAELAAFFLEGVMLPPEQSPAVAATGEAAPPDGAAQRFRT